MYPGCVGVYTPTPGFCFDQKAIIWFLVVLSTKKTTLRHFCAEFIFIIHKKSLSLHHNQMFRIVSYIIGYHPGLQFHESTVIELYGADIVNCFYSMLENHSKSYLK